MLTYDNRRLLAAQNAGLNTLEINTVQADELFPLSEKKKTWWDKFKRYKDKRNIAAGGIVPDKGLKEKPVLESSISNKKNTYKDK